MKGTYLLLISVEHPMVLSVGKLGKTTFPKTCYAYVGSALNGIEQRVQRHKRKQKKVHWHIDYLLDHAKIVDVYYKESMKKRECDIAQVFEKTFHSIPGFGCSDCTCPSHLFHGSKEEIRRLAEELCMKKANA